MIKLTVNRTKNNVFKILLISIHGTFKKLINSIIVNYNPKYSKNMHKFYENLLNIKNIYIFFFIFFLISFFELIIKYNYFL